jgi:hypothetical protein
VAKSRNGNGWLLWLARIVAVGILTWLGLHTANIADNGKDISAVREAVGVHSVEIEKLEETQGEVKRELGHIREAQGKQTEALARIEGKLDN